MTKPTIRIPRTPLRQDLDAAEAIKVEMTRLLSELEHAANKKAPEQPGRWRHNPKDWPKTDR
jgi:hypothetical protein